MREQLCKKHHGSMYCIYIYIASCISKYQISDQLFARIESCAGLMDGLQPNLRCAAFDRVCEQFGFAMPSAACQRTATRSQKASHKWRPKKYQNRETVKECQRIAKGVGEGRRLLGMVRESYTSMLVVNGCCDFCWCSMCGLCFLGVCVCVCVRPWIFFAASLPCLQTIWWGNSWGCPASQSILPVPNILACPSSPIAIIEKSVWLMNADNRRQFPSRSVK